MSSKLKQALDISLEDYIAEKGIVSSIRPMPSTSTKVGYFKRQLRSENEDDENEDDLFVEDRNGTLPIVSQESIGSDSAEQQSVDVEMKIQQDSGCSEGVRTFITEEHKRGIKYIPSQQWRLQRQNQVSKKPSGVPPLMTLKTVFDQNTEQLIASLGENAKFSNSDARSRINQKFSHSWNKNFTHNNNNNFNNRRFRNNRNRNQYGKNPNMAPSFNPSIHKIEQRANTQLNNNHVKDLRAFITPPSSFLSQAPVTPGIACTWNNPNAFGQPQLVTFADMLNRIGQASTVQDRDTFTDVIRNVMRTQYQQQSAMIPTMNPENFSQMTSNELMPFAAQTLLNHISTVHQNFGPKYDMKVQKEIHNLQGKTLFYRSSGVVSADGPGIANEKVTPVTTDLSMNMRFS
ncbi:probable serine/threonine-protein kinase DDB_G0267686 [Malaya genurostris]|uniref:probable serine/threonine-protein kinase DDB_G0267686 n=1 Tax=Malaya genurostris TaxID=325434 RepID=UPI0026F3D8C7|nr:probable serine/threonine-protein kinase DDB_G0267686 [Malaya genurostris]